MKFDCVMSTIPQMFGQSLKKMEVNLHGRRAYGRHSKTVQPATLKIKIDRVHDY